MPATADSLSSQEEAISYAAYRVLRHRYTGSPGQVYIHSSLDSLMQDLGYNTDFTSTDYSSGEPAALGNYIAQELIAAAIGDGANELGGYQNQYYATVNEPLFMEEVGFIGNPDIDSLNRWQAMELALFCDASGFPFTTTPKFLSPEWGNVVPFALSDSVKSTLSRDGNEWVVYHDPGPPPYISLDGGQQTESYRWGFDLVIAWSALLDPYSPQQLDISPGAIGNLSLEDMPTDQASMAAFYDWENEMVMGSGHAVNPSTGLPYESQLVNLGDFARAVVEYWSEGPTRESPPGIWYVIYNQVSQNPDFEWKWKGEGEALSELEHDVKAYFTIGGAMHDAAIAAWSAKGYYDHIRPVSAIRAMAELGQSSDEQLPNYHPAGLELEPGHIEMIQVGDTLHINDTIHIANSSDLGLLKMRA